MSNEIPWIREQIVKVYPNFDINGGIDFDQNGQIAANEIADMDRDRFVSESEAKVFYLINKDTLNNAIPYFHWGNAFSIDNPIHELIYLESKLQPDSEVEQAYTFLTDILTTTRESLSNPANDEELSPFTKMARVHLALENNGANFLSQLNSALFTDDIINRTFDCDTSTFVLLSVAFELGWPVYAVSARRHVFAIWDSGTKEPLYFETHEGDAHTIESYINRFHIHQTSIDQGVYLRKLSGDELGGLFYASVALTEVLNGNLEEALNDFNTAVGLYPLDEGTINNRAVTFAKLGRYDEALTDLQRVLQLDPNDSYVYNNFGYVEMLMEQYEKAINDYNRSIELEPNDAEIYKNRALAEGHLRRFEDAIIDLNRAIELDPTNAFYYAERGRAKSGLGRYQEAIEDFNRSLELNPDDASVRENLEDAQRLLSGSSEIIHMDIPQRR